MSLVTEEFPCKQERVVSRVVNGEKVDRKRGCGGVVTRSVSLDDGWYVAVCDRCDYRFGGFVSKDRLRELKGLPKR